MQNIVKLSVICAKCHLKALYAESDCAECNYAECNYAERRYAECRGVKYYSRRCVYLFNVSHNYDASYFSEVKNIFSCHLHFRVVSYSVCHCTCTP